MNILPIHLTSEEVKSCFLSGTSIQYARAEAKVKELLSKAIVVGECWECHLVPNAKGYPNVSFGRIYKMRANRLVLFVSKPNTPIESLALHTCDNRRCIRPDHLYGGTAQDNSTDMVERGRQSNQTIAIWRKTP